MDDSNEITEVKTEPEGPNSPHIHFRRTTSPEPASISGKAQFGPRNPDKSVWCLELCCG